MKSIKTYVTFTSSLIDDGEWSDGSQFPVIPPGKSIAIMIVKKLRDSNIKVSEPLQHSFYGWAFDAKYEHNTFKCLLQFPDSCLLIIENKYSMITQLLGNSKNTLSSFVKKFDDVLEDITSISEIHWFTKEEYDQGQK